MRCVYQPHWPRRAQAQHMSTNPLKVSQPSATPSPPLLPSQCYHYTLTNSEVHDPLRHRYSLHVRRPLDLAAMRDAAGALVGTHDFTQFSNIGEEGGRPRKRNPVKTLRRVELVELGDSMPGALRIEVRRWNLQRRAEPSAGPT